MRCIGPSQLIMFGAVALLAFFALVVADRQGASLELALMLVFGTLVLIRLSRIGIWVDDDEVVLRNAWKTVRSPIDHVEILAGMMAEDIADIDRMTDGNASRARKRVGDETASRELLRNRLIIDGEQFELDAMLGRKRSGQAEAAAKVVETLYAAKARRSAHDK